MFLRSSGLVFLAISSCVRAIPHPQEQCNVNSTVTQTVTVTATRAINSAVSSSPPAGSNKDKNGRLTNPSMPTVATNMRHGGKGNNNGRGSTTLVSATSTIIANAAASTKSVASGKTRSKNGNNSSDPQTSLTLDPRVIAKGFANDGQDVPSPGQVKSLTSTNNFINFCLTVPKLDITNGKQIATGSCNPAPMGAIPSSDKMPSSKFTFPKNFGTLKANQTFTIKMAIRNMQTGFFVNANDNYFAAPQQLNAQGQIQGHSHVVIEELTSLGQTTPTNPKNFVFFKGLNAAAANGELNATVPNGLDVGFYKLSSINTASNHQPLLVPIAQHGSLDDAIYFSVTSDGVAVGKGGKSTTPTTASKSVATHPQGSATVRAAGTSNIASASSSLPRNSRLPASHTVLPSATGIPRSATSVPQACDDSGVSPPTASFISTSTSLPSMKGERELGNRFTLW